jgi:2-polyprenyl-6-methoxyphenol hydroxylase-like FAD-dependent oxidoreductase
MKKQRICIVGDGLSGLMTVIALNNLPNLEVHLIAKENKRMNDKRTTAISANNFNFIQDIMSTTNKKLFGHQKKLTFFTKQVTKKLIS